MKFFKTLIAATLGTLLALVVIFIVLAITLSTVGEEPEPYIRENTVLKLNVSGALPARSIDNPFDELLNPTRQKAVSLETLKNNLTKAAADDNIKGVLLEIDFVTEGWANLQAAHRAITQFRDSTDKFIYAMTNDAGFNEKGYFLATAADSVFSPPESFFEFDGFYTQVTFYDNLFERIGVEAEITRSGKYKGAVEPYLRDDLSEENEYQLTQIIDGVSSTFLEAVSKKSGKSVEELNNLLNGTPHLTAGYGYEQGFIDSLMYAHQLDSLITRRIGFEDEDDTFETITNSRYAKVSNESAGIEDLDSDGKIAVIYASGIIIPEIAAGGGFLNNQQFITAPWFKEQLEEATEDDDVKALVVRINSPGGSGSTSDAIWKMIQETREKMPVIVSMGPVAASGGYYIAMAADTIVAEPTTITGSIGVFSTKFNTKQLFNDELGITFDEVRSHEHADWLSTTRGFTPSEQKAFQAFSDSFYDAFITKVAQSRGLTKPQVHDVAQGRVWIAADAQQQKLVDVLGGLDKALRIAAEKAELEEFETEDYPKAKDLFQLLMGSTQSKVQSWFGDSILGNDHIQKLDQQFSMMKKQDLMLLFPYDISIE
ncbi:MAG: signal peptide peptidase SppA [Balneolaceae bacterium]|nr:signal peptide peptidase SppA [Balneolaceae bacterium]